MFSQQGAPASLPELSRDPEVGPEARESDPFGLAEVERLSQMQEGTPTSAGNTQHATTTPVPSKFGQNIHTAKVVGWLRKIETGFQLPMNTLPQEI